MRHYYFKLFFAALLCIATTGARAHDFEVDGIYYNITDETNKTVAVTYKGTSYNEYFDEYTGSVVIPENVTYNGNTYSVTTIGGSAFNSCTSLTNVTIGNSVTSIGYWAFGGCSSLTNIEIPNSVTSIGSSAFRGCTGLTSIEIPNSVTSIGDYAFNSCTSLTNVTIGNSVTSIGYWAFGGCSSLTNIEIPNSVTSIGHNAFVQCTNLTNIEIPNSVTSIGDDAFYGCSGLTNVVIGNSVTTIGDGAFSYCYELTSVVIGNSVTTIGDGAFSYCYELTSVVIGNSVINIGNNAFYRCSNLKTLINFSNLTFYKGDSEYGYVASYAEKVVNAPNGFIDGDFGWIENEDGMTLAGYLGDATELTLPAKYNGKSVTTIRSAAFYGCSGLTNVVISNSVTTIGDEAFSGCTGLTSITIPNSVTSIGEYAFAGCTNLTSIEIPSSVTSIGKKAFHNCTGLTSIEIPNSITKIEESTFQYCGGLKSIEIPNSITEIGERAFYCCNNLRSVSIGNNVTIIGEKAFCLCDTLANIEIPNSVISIGKEAFSSCDDITNLTIPKSVTNIGSSAFAGCTGLESIVVESGNHIYDSRDNCNAIIEKNTNTLISGCKNTVIPNSVTRIGEYAFAGCTELKYLIFPSSVRTISDGAFNACWDCKLVIMHYISISAKGVPKSICFYVSSPQLVTHYSEFSINVKLIYAADYTITPTTVKATIKNNLPEVITNLGFNNGEDTLVLFCGLEPDKNYSFPITMGTEYGYTVEDSLTVRTEQLVFNTLKAKATSNTRAVICAETNISEEESGTGFEWRRIDAPDLVPSEFAPCAVHEGVMEGALHNLSANTYYKYRPCYTSQSGKSYYGEWIGFGTADAYVYFTPTVHTYATASAGTNAARLSGYVLAGSDDIIEQGFEYWPVGKAETAVMHSTHNNGNVKRVTATGQRMSIVVGELDYGTVYMCRAYARTAKETVYGEEQSFETSYPNSIEENREESITIQTSGNTVYVNGCNENVLVYTLFGTVVYNGPEKEITLNSGTYIVKAGNITKKIQIR